MNEPIEPNCVLIADMEDGKLVVRDDRGYRVKFVRRIEMVQQIKEVTFVTVQFIQTDGSGKPRT